MVIKDEGIIDEPIYLNNERKFSKFIYLTYDSKLKHYNVIISMKVFKKKIIYCDYCKSGYDHRNKHNC